MIDKITGAPIGAQEDSAISFGGVRYTMQVGTLCAYELSLMGIDPADMFTAGTERDRRVTSFAHVLRLFRATIAHNFVQRKQAVPSPEELALMLEGEPRDLFTEITNKTLELLFPKLMALTRSTVKLQEPAPPTSEPLPN